MKLEGLHFVNVADIQEDVTHELKKAQKRKFQQWKSLYIYASGAYFELK
jgi:hypothetical protein